MATIKDIPNELLVEIFSETDEQTVCSLALTCNRFSDIIYQDPYSKIKILTAIGSTKKYFSYTYEGKTILPEKLLGEVNILCNMLADKVNYSEIMEIGSQIFLPILFRMFINGDSDFLKSFIPSVKEIVSEIAKNNQVDLDDGNMENLFCCIDKFLQRMMNPSEEEIEYHEIDDQMIALVKQLADNPQIIRSILEGPYGSLLRDSIRSLIDPDTIDNIWLAVGLMDFPLLLRILFLFCPVDQISAIVLKEEFRRKECYKSKDFIVENYAKLPNFSTRVEAASVHEPTINMIKDFYTKITEQFIG